MIQIYSSNSYEFLQRILLELVKAERSAMTNSEFAAFRRTKIIVPSEAVKDDLMRAFADDEGIASSLQMMFIGNWLDPRTGTVIGKSSSGLELEWLIWLLLQDEQFISRPDCVRLKHYVENRNKAEYAQLARRIANLFTTYVSYRLDWVVDWMRDDALANDAVLQADSPRRIRESRVLAEHPDARWQKAMWNILAHGMTDSEKSLPPWSGAEGIRAVPERFAQDMAMTPDALNGLHIFIPSSLPPLALPFLMAQARHAEVSVYLMNPSKAYWFESGENFGETALSWSEGAMPENRFSWFRKNASASRALIERMWTFAGEAQTSGTVYEADYAVRDDQCVLEGPTFKTLDPSRLLELHADAEQDALSVFRDPCADNDDPTLLQSLQKAVLEDSDLNFPSNIREGDRSLTIVKSPTTLREVQAVFDWIQSLLDNSSGDDPIRADDILVVTPDINAYAGVIASAHKSREGSSVAFRIAGCTAFDSDDLAQAIIATGHFLFSRANREDFEELLSFESVSKSCFHSRPDFKLVKQWLTAAGYRWGLDAAHACASVRSGLARKEDEKGEDFEGTLSRALERLVAGFYADGEHTDLVGDVLPMLGNEARGYESSAVTEHRELFDDLIAYGAALAEARRTASPEAENTIEGWCAHTRSWINRLFAASLNTSEMNEIKNQLLNLESSAAGVLGNQTIGFEVFWDALSSLLKEKRGMSRATGSVTFAGMDDFRRIPFKAIAVIGLDAGQAFPGRNRSEEFDLMNAQAEIDGKIVNARRRGDGDSRASNRNVFLDLLLSARQCVLISYTTGVKNIEAVPSVVVQELKRLLAKHLGAETVEKRLTVKLPMSMWRPENFEVSKGPVRSRNKTALEAYRIGLESGFLASRDLLIDEPILEPRGKSHRFMTTTALAKIMNDPGRWLEKQIRINSLSEDEEPDVPLAVDVTDPLTKWKLTTDCAREAASEMSDVEILRRIRNNPTISAAPLREIHTAPFLQKVRKLNQAFDAFFASLKEAGSFKGGEILFKGDVFPYFDGISFDAIKLFRGDDEHAPLVHPVIVTSASHERRLFLQFVAHAAMGRECEFALFTCDDSDEAVLKRWTTRVETTDLAKASREVLRSWIRTVNAHCNRAPRLWLKMNKRPTDPPEYSLILSEGPYMDALVRAHESLKKSFDSFKKLFEVTDTPKKSPAKKRVSSSRRTSAASLTPDETVAEVLKAFANWETAVKDAEDRFRTTNEGICHD